VPVVTITNENLLQESRLLLTYCASSDALKACDRELQ